MLINPKSLELIEMKLGWNELGIQISSKLPEFEVHIICIV